MFLYGESANAQAICGTKFHDWNCNGQKDTGEPGLSGWQINITNNATGATQSLTTGGNGQYCTGDLANGTYSVYETPQPFWQQTYPDPSGAYTVHINNQSWMNVDFGNCFCEEIRPDLNHGLYTQDTNCWQVVREPSSPLADLPPPPRTVSQVVPPHPAWAPCWWVSADPSYGGTSSSAAPLGEYEYQCCFCLDEGFSNPELNMDLFTDDTAQVYLNGVQIANLPTKYSGTPTNVLWNNLDDFRPGWNCVTIVVQNIIGATGFCVPNGLVTADNGRCCENFRKSCVTPPAGMIGWWPLDEAAGPTANDIAGMREDGSFVGSPTTTVGAVGQAMQFSSGNHIKVINPAASALNAGTGDFTLDAWIKVDPLSTGFRTIASKTRIEGFNERGYRFGVHTTHQLRADIRSDLASPTYFGGPLLNDGKWHHVALTVMRNSATGLKLYVDGVAVSFTTTSFANSTLENGGTFYIGDRGGSFAFSGPIDEVQFFKRALTPAEVIGIYYAGSEGKCRERCEMPPVSTYWNGMSDVAVSVEICNHSMQSATYNFGFTANAGISGSCPSVGPFLPSAMPAPVTVSAGQCATVEFNIPMPSGIPNPGDYACYEVCVTNQQTGIVRCCYGLLLNQEDRAEAPGNGGGRVEVIGLPVGGTKTVRFVFIDQGFTVKPGGLDVDYIIHAATKDNESARLINIGGTGKDGFGMPDGYIEDIGASLDGMPAGEPITGVMSFEGPGATATVEVDVTALAYDPFKSDWLIFAADDDDDGDYAPITCKRIRIAGWDAGDTNCNGVIGYDDVDPFVLALLDPDAYAVAYPDPGCHVTNCDLNGDGYIDARDLQSLIELLVNP
jgi:hypothetical protein